MLLPDMTNAELIEMARDFRGAYRVLVNTLAERLLEAEAEIARLKQREAEGL